MLRFEDHSEEAGYGQEEQSSQQREDELAASASMRSMDGSYDAEGSSKAQVCPHRASVCTCGAPHESIQLLWVRSSLGHLA